MAFTAQTEYDCQDLSYDHRYTSFKWVLMDYVVCRQFYEGMIGKFMFSCTNIKCELEYTEDLDLNQRSGKAWRKMVVKVSVAERRNSCYGTKIIVSIIDANGAKLISRSSQLEYGSPLLSFEMIGIERTLLGNEKYLPNGTLTLFCELLYPDFTRLESIPIGTTQIHDKSLVKNFQKTLTEFFENKELCDVTIVVKDTKIYANKIVLAANSPVFEAMFNANMKEKISNTVIITDIDVDTFQAFVRFMYTGTIERNNEKVNDIIVVADKYQVDFFKLMCERYMAQQAHNQTEYYWRLCPRKKEYTSFTWDLRTFSTLREFHEKHLVSFIITNTNYDCTLKWTNHLNTSVGVVVRFPAKCTLKFKVMVSFIDRDDKKLTTKSKMKLEYDTSLEFEMGEKNVDTYLCNGTLRILCELMYVDLTPVILPEMTVIGNDLNDDEPIARNFRREIQRKFELYFNDKSFCDVTIVVDNAEIHAHKVVLAANSKVFRAMFSKNTTEQIEDTVTIVDSDATTVEAFIKYMYTGNFGKTEQLIRDLLILADKYQVIELVSLCEKYIKKHLDPAAATALLTARH